MKHRKLFVASTGATLLLLPACGTGGGGAPISNSNHDGTAASDAAQVVAEASTPLGSDGSDSSGGSDGSVSSDGQDGVASPDAEAGTPDPDSGDSAIQVPHVNCGPGMVRIPAKHQSFMMGFSPSEAPGTIYACYIGKHKVTFTYDFCMDANLVTQAEFSKLMGFNPSKHQTGDLMLPVDSETWYDAILYCNKKSQIEGRQPAYSYGAVTLNGKSASNIAGVTVDIKKNGYRLPTNAEYEYAERANTTGFYFFSPTTTPNITALGAVYAWYSGNTSVTSPSERERRIRGVSTTSLEICSSGSTTGKAPT